MADGSDSIAPPIARAIAAAGSQSALARLVGCTPQLISAYANGSRRVSAEMAIRIAQRVGVVSIAQLRPDLSDMARLQPGEAAK